MFIEDMANAMNPQNVQVDPQQEAAVAVNEALLALPPENGANQEPVLQEPNDGQESPRAGAHEDTLWVYIYFMFVLCVTLFSGCLGTYVR